MALIKFITQCLSFRKVQQMSSRQILMVLRIWQSYWKTMNVLTQYHPSIVILIRSVYEFQFVDVCTYEKVKKAISSYFKREQIIYNMLKFTYSFLRNTYLYELPVKVINVTKQQNNHLLVEFNDSIFHPQGGGQPNDIGFIKTHDSQYKILGAVPNKQTGKISYKLQPTVTNIEVGDQMIMKIDKETRVKNAKLHSAGHLIDVAVSRCKLAWKASKGYHFEDSPYVEYIGACQDYNKTKADLQVQIDNILKSEDKVAVTYYTTEQALNLKLIDESYKASSIRVVGMLGQQCPCGGTHIEKINEISKIEIVKVAKKGKNIRVSYKL